MAVSALAGWQLAGASEARSSEASPADDPINFTDEAQQVEQETADRLGVSVGDRTLVGPDIEGDERLGYVNWDVTVGITHETAEISPVYAEGGPSSDEGEIIAYWGLNVGWIDREVYEDPSFDYQALVDEQNRRAAEFMQP